MNKSEESSFGKDQGLYSYIAYLREAIVATGEQIRKQNIKAKETFFNISVHYNLNHWTREKIQQSNSLVIGGMDEIGVESLTDSTTHRVKSGYRKKIEKTKMKKQKSENTEETGKMGEPKKKVKVSSGAASTNGFQQEPKNK